MLKDIDKQLSELDRHKRSKKQRGRPTKREIAELFQVNQATIYRTLKDQYAPGRYYTDHPAASRCFCNADMERLREFFKDE